VDYKKLDAALAAALDDSSDSAAAQDTRLLSVFVHLTPDASGRHGDKLARLGVPKGSLQGGIATATLSPRQVRELSEQPWVRQLRLSSPLRLLGNP
jgi:hypothetical protein